MLIWRKRFTALQIKDNDVLENTEMPTLEQYKETILSD